MRPTAYLTKNSRCATIPKFVTLKDRFGSLSHYHLTAKFARNFKLYVEVGNLHQLGLEAFLSDQITFNVYLINGSNVFLQ